MKKGDSNDPYELEGVTVKANRLPQYNDFWVNVSLTYKRNELLYGHASPYRAHFQKGGEDAIKIIGGSIAAIYGVSVGATQGVSFLVRSRALSIARQIVKSPVKNTYLNIGKFNVGAALGDFTAQFATNGNRIERINWISTIGQLTIGGTNILASITSSATGSFFSFTGNDYNLNNGLYGVTVNSIFERETWTNFTLGAIGNAGAGAIGGQFAKAYQPDMFGKSVIETGLNTYFGIGATKSSEYLTKKK